MVGQVSWVLGERLTQWYKKIRDGQQPFELIKGC